MSVLTKYTVEAYVAVVAARQQQANDFWKENVDPDGGEHTFRAGLSPDGSEPATWYWCHGVLTLENLQTIKAAINPLPQSDVRLVINPTAHGKLNDLLTHFMHDPPKIRVLENRMTPQEVLDAVSMQVVQTEEL